VTWVHQSVALYPDTLGAIFSVSAVVDIHITTGLQSRTEKTLLAYFTHAGSKGQVQSLAYSNDKGKTWIKYANNPILTHFENDSDFRDSKVFWHAETERWVMVIGGTHPKFA
jgi:fructan beta-fructosidase